MGTRNTPDEFATTIGAALAAEIRDRHESDLTDLDGKHDEAEAARLDHVEAWLRENETLVISEHVWPMLDEIFALATNEA